MTTPNYSHEYPTSDDEWEHCKRCGPFAVYVSKVGGGTLGRSYEGAWHYQIVDYRDGSPTWGLIVTRGSDLNTGTPATHAEAAEIVADFCEGES
jgi:hypothetical protein